MNCRPHAAKDGSCSCCHASVALAVTSTTTGCCQAARDWVYELMFSNYSDLENSLREALQLMDVAEHAQDSSWLKRRNALALKVGVSPVKWE